MNVAVTVDVPTTPKSNEDPAIATIEPSADAYDHVPLARVDATVGAVIAASASPYVADTFAQLNVGVAFATVNVAVVLTAFRFVVSVGVNVAVTTDDPAPAIVTVFPEIVATDEFADTYPHAPAIDDPPNDADGSVTPKATSSNVLAGNDNAPSDGVAFATVTVIVTVPPET